MAERKTRAELPRLRGSAADRKDADEFLWQFTANDSLFREMLDGCMIVGDEGQILDANPAY